MQRRVANDELRGPESSSPPPLFFVSVASKGLIHAVSLLFATLAGRSVSVAVKGFREEDVRRYEVTM